MKTIKKYIYLTILFFICLLLFTTKSNAAGSINLKPSKTSLTVGDEFNISVNLSGASVATLTTRITVDTSKVDYVSGPSNTNFSNGKVIYTWTDPSGGENPKTDGTIATFKFKAKSAGTASFSVSGNFYTPDETPVNPSFSGTSVTIKEKVTVPETPTPTPPSTGGSGSGESTGGGNSGSTGGTTGGGSTGGTNQGGGSGTTGGTNQGGTGSAGGNNQSGNTGSSGGSGSTGGTNGNTNQGNSNQGGNSNTGNTQTLSSNANLKELHLNVEGLSPAFQKTVTRYNLIVGNDISQISVNAIPEEANAKVSVTGNTNLKVGVNEVRITVTAPDGKTTKSYIIEVTKTENPDLANANLETLAIENVMLEPEFNPDVTSYNAIIGSDVENIRILAIPQIEGASVQVTGADNIVFGDNTITVNVIAKDGVTNKEYIIKLYKTTPKEENQNNVIVEEEQNNKEPIQENKITAGEVIFVVIIVGSISGIIYILIRKYRMEN